MLTFATGRDAKEFLVNRIVAEAQRENVPLSEVEKKMLYFSETALIRQIRATDRADNKDDYDTWAEAVQTLKKEGHYILVMIAAAGADRARGKVSKLLATALVLVSVFVIAIVLWATHR